MHTLLPHSVAIRDAKPRRAALLARYESEPGVTVTRLAGEMNLSIGRVSQMLKAARIDRQKAAIAAIEHRKKFCPACGYELAKGPPLPQLPGA